MGIRLLAAGLVAIAFAGCGGGGDPPARAKPEPSATPRAGSGDEAAEQPADEADDLAAVLGHRARALEQGDGRAFAATSTGAQRGRDRKAARRAQSVSLERVRLVADDLQTSGDRAVVTADLSYRVRGMERPFLTMRRVTARKTRAGWRVTSDRARGEPLPWEVAGFRALRTRHVVLLAPPGLDAAPLQSGLEDAYREIRRDLPSRDLPASVLVVAAADAAQAERLTGRIASGVVALANVSVEWGPPPALKVQRVLAQRLIVVVDRWGAQDAAARQSTLVHEMTHTALDPDTSARTPPWLSEGLAMYVSNDDRTAEARLRASGAAPSTRLRRLCRPSSIFSLSGREQGAAYAASSAAAYAIVARKGNQGLFRLYDAFNDSAIAGHAGAATTDRVMRRTIGISLDELDAAVAGG